LYNLVVVYHDLLTTPIIFVSNIFVLENCNTSHVHILHKELFNHELFSMHDVLKSYSSIILVKTDGFLYWFAPNFVHL
jgi:hypothetical protein